ncbi:MAG: PEP-CTERM sorting domain-containing protein [Planctomycetales bacterium]|nr:PEP-CTERM sorting domain-containing protein [Planctomycetales bacterium]
MGSGNYAGSNYPSPYSGPYYAYLQATDYRGSGWCYQGLMLSGSPFEFTAAGDSITADLYQSMPFDSDSQIFSIVLKKGETWAAATQLAIGTFTDLPSPVGTWVPRTLTYVATTADLNVPLWLQLWSGPNGPTQVLADNVTVSYTPIPEPSTLALLAAGLVGLLCYAWRKRK